MSVSSPSHAKPSLAMCCIVKNEAHTLKRCLDSITDVVDQIVVVDTGSEDNTVAIAHRYGAVVNHFDWCDDFSAARNFSLSLTDCDWILILDADEELIIQNPNWREQLNASLTHFGVIRHDVYEVGGVVGGQHLRLFRNLPGLHYVGRYHEQLRFPEGISLAGQVLQEVAINHYGNSDENIELKNLTRDIPILEQMRQEKSIDLWRLDCLARKYLRVGELDKAADCYQEAHDRLEPYLSKDEIPQPALWIPTLLTTLGSNALEKDDLETARLFCTKGLEWFPTFPPLNYLTGEMMIALDFPMAAKSYFEYCLVLGESEQYYDGDPFAQDFLRLHPLCALGWVYFQLQDFTMSREYLDRAKRHSSDDVSVVKLQHALDNL